MALDKPDQQQELKRLFQTSEHVDVPPPSKSITEALQTRRLHKSLWQKPIPLYQAVLSCVVVATALILWTGPQPTPVLPRPLELPVVAPVVRTDTIYIQLPPKEQWSVPKKKTIRWKLPSKIDRPATPPMADMNSIDNTLASSMGDRTIQNAHVTSKYESGGDTIPGFTVSDRQDYFRFIRAVQ